MSLRVPCELCGGCGKRPLTQSQSATVAAVGADWTTSSEVAARLTGADRVSTTLVNQLAALATAGVLERRPWAGRKYQWRIAQVA